MFNPYLMSELMLDEFECAAVEMCTGEIPAGIMAVELARGFCTNRSAAEYRLQEAFDKLDRYYALRWHQADTDSIKEPIPVPPLHRLNLGECMDRGRKVSCLTAPLSILWEITHACNLGCVHCLSACGAPHPLELSTAEARALVEELAALRVFWFTLGGGEPLLRPDIYEIIAFATEKNLCVRLTTNGYAVDREVLRRLADLNVFSAQISLDGLESTHDRIRNRPGAFRHAIRAIELFVENGYTTLANFAVNAWNWTEVAAVASLAADLGVSSMKVGLVVPLGRGAQNGASLTLSHECTKRLAMQMWEIQARLEDRISLQLDGLFPFLLTPDSSSQAVDDGCGPGCSAGVAQLVVSYDGSVYSCPYLRETSAGNVRSQSLKEIWKNEEFFGPLRSLDRRLLKGKCHQCEFRPHQCTGGCRGAAWSTSGDLYAEDPHCWREISDSFRDCTPHKSGLWQAQRLPAL